MKNYIILPFMLVLICLICSSFDIKETDALVIEVVGTKTGYVLIGDNKTKHWKGDYFKASESVFLNPNEYLKVRNRRTKQPIEICYEDFSNHNIPSGSSFIRLKMALTKSADRFDTYVSAVPWYLIQDTVRIECPYKLNTNDCGFILRSIPGDLELTPVPFDNETNELIFTSDYFFIKNDISPDNINTLVFRMEYWNNGKVTPITSNLKFIYKQQYNNYNL